MFLGSVGENVCRTGEKSVRGDVLLAISFSPYSNEVFKLAGNAQERRIPVIVITDSILSPLGLFSDVCLEVKETEDFGFRGVVLGALMCLALSLVLELGRQIEQQKKEMTRIRHLFRCVMWVQTGCRNFS